MRYAFLALFLSLLPASAAPTTPEAFIAAIKSAIAAKSTDQLLALTCTTGMSDADKKRAVSIYPRVLFPNPVDSVALGPLPPDFQLGHIANGKKIEPTSPPQGLVQIRLTPAQGNGPSSASLPFAIISGGYYLVSSKTTDLGWKGPPDNTLIFIVRGQRTSGIKVDAKWNASGVEQERIYTTGNAGFLGQYFESINVTCADPNADLSLELMENGKDIVPSIKGKGTVTYKK
jgi:hypothetical protein